MANPPVAMLNHSPADSGIPARVSQSEVWYYCRIVLRSNQSMRSDYSSSIIHIRIHGSGIIRPHIFAAFSLPCPGKVLTWNGGSSQASMALGTPVGKSVHAMRFYFFSFMTLARVFFMRCALQLRSLRRNFLRCATKRWMSWNYYLNKEICKLSRDILNVWNRSSSPIRLLILLTRD
jgi:hypothetical protein